MKMHNNSLPSTTTASIWKVNNSDRRKLIITTSIILVAFFCIIIAYISDIRIENVLSTHKRAFSGQSSNNNINFGDCISNNTHNMTPQPAAIMNSTSEEDGFELRILIGILTVADQYQQRDLLRRVYHVQPRPTGVRVDIKFVFCQLYTEEQRVLIPLEIMTHDDIIILNCTENMNEGKTYTYFSSLPEMFNTEDPPYHYVMKADYDTFVHVQNLADSLKPLSRVDLYYGFTLPCESMEMHGDYMAGFGYVMSWDIVEWISKSDIPRNHQKGYEDKVVGDWLNSGNKGSNSFNAKWKMYDYPVNTRHTICGQHPLWPDTIAVHKLKTLDKWIRTLSYFNLTNNLKPSKLYYLLFKINDVLEMTLDRLLSRFISKTTFILNRREYSL